MLTACSALQTSESDTVCKLHWTLSGLYFAGPRQPFSQLLFHFEYWNSKYNKGNLSCRLYGVGLLYPQCALCSCIREKWTNRYQQITSDCVAADTQYKKIRITELPVTEPELISSEKLSDMCKVHSHCHTQSQISTLKTETWVKEEKRSVSLPLNGEVWKEKALYMFEHSRPLRRWAGSVVSVGVSVRHQSAHEPTTCFVYCFCCNGCWSVARAALRMSGPTYFLNRTTHETDFVTLANLLLVCRIHISFCWRRLCGVKDHQQWQKKKQWTPEI